MSIDALTNVFVVLICNSKGLSMNKTEIINALAYMGVPSGSELTEREIPGLGITTFGVHAGSDTGGIKILAAQMYANHLNAEVGSLPENPNPTLFSKLHRASSDFYQVVAGNTIIEEVEAEAIDMHRAVVKRLREIAHKLGVQYEEPDDPLLESPLDPPKIDGGE